MPLILLTNDDGISAVGLSALKEAVADLGEVWTIAPHIERSACGRAVTLDRPLRVRELAPRELAVDGTPADCVLLAFRALLQSPPDLVIAGINHGYNLGEDLDYSGTVSAAAEAALQGAGSSIAISVKSGSDIAVIERAAGFASILAARLLEDRLPPYSYINVNIPPGPLDRLRWTRQGNPLAPGEVEAGIDPRGKPYYWIANRPDEIRPPPDTDRGALADGCISMSLLTLERNFRGDWERPDLGRDGLLVEDGA